MSGKLECKYELANGPQRIATDEYVELCNQRYAELLASDPSEPETQCFLEKHPCLVPVGPSVGKSLYPLHCGLISQPTLPGQKSYVPDFMWIGAHSGAWFPTLIEIEKPSKKIFNQNGKTSQDFNHARDQLYEWRSWFCDSANVQQFVNMYGIPADWQRLTMKLRIILVYGRRAEFEDSPELGKRRGTLMHDGDELMSFDRLRADDSMEDSITLKATRFGRYTAKWIPSIFDLGPGELSRRLPFIDGISDAIDRNPEISSDRKEFLKERLPYWTDYAKSKGGKLESSGDRE